jgi:hypothetical protein
MFRCAVSVFLIVIPLLGCSSHRLGRGLHATNSEIVSDRSNDKGFFRDVPPPLQVDSSSEYFVLQKSISFVDPKGAVWTAPAGTKTDGATIPQVFLSVIGDRFDPSYCYAAFVHDAYCQDVNNGLATYQSRPWQDVHQMFYDAAVANGLDENKALIMLAAIWLGGPRWGDDNRLLDAVPVEIKKQEFAKCKQWLEKKPRSKEGLLAWMNKRESSLLQGISPPI